MPNVTRRMILVRAVSVATLGSVNAIVPSSIAADAGSKDVRAQFDDFIQLSAILTGIRKESLVHITEPLTDLKLEYFRIAKSQKDFPALHKIFLDAVEKFQPPPGSEMAEVCRAILVDSPAAVRYLARSIMLLWYFGAWYDPGDLEKAGSDPFPTRFKVVSELAYTQGWVWKIAQAHPMGYSELQFGYWAMQPPAETLNLERFMIPAKA